MKKDKVKKPIYKRWWFIAIVAVVVLGAIGSMGDDTENNDTAKKNSTEEQSTETGGETEPKEAEAETETEVVEPVEVTSDELISALKSNALKANSTYKDQYIMLTGQLSGIDAQGAYFTLSPMNEEFSFDTIMCRIEEEHLDQVMNFEEKQNVTVIGTITDIGEVMGYTVKVESIQ